MSGRTCRAGCLAAIAAQMTGCAAPFSDLQSARLVGEGNFEATAHYTAVSFSASGTSDTTQREWGVQAAVGVSDDVDLRGRFERISVDDADLDTNVLAAGPKVGLATDRAALFVPIGFAVGGDIETSKTWQVQPTILLTAPANGKFELNGSGKILIPMSKDGGDELVAFNIGAGISTDLTRWALRPEFGVMISPGEEGAYRQASLGLTVFSGKGR